MLRPFEMALSLAKLIFPLGDRAGIDISESVADALFKGHPGSG
jgi:hypothetical protein